MGNKQFLNFSKDGKVSNNDTKGQKRSKFKEIINFWILYDECGKMSQNVNKLCKRSQIIKAVEKSRK
jgi:hypothetical protein